MSGETRKLQKVGGGTYTVSVPKEWATEQSLSAGETVHLYPDGDGSLVVCSEDEIALAAETELSIDGSSADPADAIERILRAAYVAGVERLTLTAPDGLAADRRRRIERLVRDRTGTRVVDADDSSVTVKTVLDDGEVSVQRTVVRQQFVTLSLFRTAVDLVLDPGANGRDRIDDRHVDARRLSSLVTRQFGRSLSRPATAVDLGVDRSTAFDCYRTAQALDRIADHATDVATATDGIDDATARDDLRSIAEAVRLHVEAATTAVVEAATVDDARDLRSGRAEIDEQVDDAEGTGDTRRVLDLLVASADCGDRIADVALEAAMRRAG